MTRVHDMGGRFGEGRITPEAEGAPVFSTDWHARALAVTLACGALGQWNIDGSRHARERLSAADYTRLSYYEKWMAALANLLVEQGVLREEDLAQPFATEETQALPRHPLAARCLHPEAVAQVLAAGGPAVRDSQVAPQFRPGDRVRTRRPANTLVNGGHTRLPAYAGCAEGQVLRLHGSHVFPDSNAHDRGEAPEPLYAVSFAAQSLWPHAEHPRDEVVLDLWQSYLEPA